MFLKSMELFGFKSFADKTKITFESGVTIIVGPNGCGKSNVVDAVKWVLGEKQARNIRGEKMEDIIFSGTDQRKHLSLSEVFLTIDNSNRILDFESDSITIGRRVFRDGESEYLINKSPVRLKDIEKLFLDTGIGKTAYSVMEQGKIDLILSTRAEDRRYIFEEAAGISRYKLQKKESLKKLTETGGNLERINDIIKEIEREKDFKFKQAEKTKIYLSLKSKQADLDIKMNFLKYEDLLKRQKRLQADIEKLKEEREACSARVSATSAENEKDEKRKNDLQHQLFELEKRLHAYRIRVEDIDVRSDKNRRQIEEQQVLRKNTEAKIKERFDNLKRLLEEKTKTRKSEIEIVKRIEDDKKKLANFFRTRKRKIDSIHKSRGRINDKKKNISEEEERLEELRGLLEEVIKRLIDAIEKRKTELLESEKERLEVRERINDRIDSIDLSIRKALTSIELGNFEDVLEAFKSIDINFLKDDINKFEGYEDGFRSILFDKTGIHAEKEGIDKKIRNKMSIIERDRTDIAKLEEYINNEQMELEDVNEMITRVEKDLSKNENEKDWIEKHLRSLDYQILDFERQIDSYKEDIERYEKAIKSLNDEIKVEEDRLIEFNEKSESLMKKISDLTEKRSQIDNEIHNRKNVARNAIEELERVVGKINNLDKSQVELIFKKDNIEEYLWIEYEKKISKSGSLNMEGLEYNSLLNEIQELKRKILELGPINNLAIEEYRDLKKRFEYYISQKEDIERAREDIFAVIEDINKTSVEMFINTFKDIQKSFREIFRQLFDGGDATIEIMDPENVLESGIDIILRPPGKKLKNINLLSGGERALTAIALLFATYMAKPSPFCFLDEIDAPLDEENIGRFVKLLREFSRGSQFIIVTHNKKTMSIGESLYGVTMEEPGVSKVVSLKMDRTSGWH